MLRHPFNSNLRIHHGSVWNGRRVRRAKGGLVIDYLSASLGVLEETVNEYRRSVMIRFDLHVPEEYLDLDPEVITRFINALKAKVSADLARKARDGGRVYPCRVRVVWAKERDDSIHPHYHIAITLNRDAYFTLGNLKTTEEAEALWSRGVDSELRENLTDRIRAAWASALHIPRLEAVGMVHVPKNPVHTIDRNSDNYDQQFADAFRRLSYLAKARTKYYGDGSRHFGCSRV